MRTIISISLLFCLSFAYSQNKKKKFKVPDYAVKHANIEYAKAGNKSLLLDLYLPKNQTGKIPLVMWVHGGGWKNGSKDKLKGLWLVKHGYAVASINYRLTHEAIWPAQINDCRSAVRFLKSNADKYQLNGQIVAWGGSAGGHLVAVLGTQDLPENEKISSRVDAVIDWYGPSDLLTMPPNTISATRTRAQVEQSNGAKLLGKTVMDVPELAKEASAFWNVSKDDPPFLIMHGELDPGVPLIQSKKLHAKQKEVGAPSELIIVKGAKHGGKEFMTEEMNQHILNFLKKVLK